MEYSMKDSVAQLLGNVRSEVERLSRSRNIVSADSRWQDVESGFASWLRKLPAELSPVSRNLELLRRACEAFPELSLRSDPSMTEAILEGALQVGETTRPFGGRPSGTIVERSISQDITILYTIKDEKGGQWTVEFID